jgi:hypothetical protein
MFISHFDHIILTDENHARDTIREFHSAVIVFVILRDGILKVFTLKAIREIGRDFNHKLLGANTIIIFHTYDLPFTGSIAEICGEVKGF